MKEEVTFEEMQERFGRRIRKAVHVNEETGVGAIKAREMNRICKKWKLWNRDIRRAWWNYMGHVLVPYIIVDPKLLEGVKSRYGEMKI